MIIAGVTFKHRREYLAEKERLLRQFGIPITDEIRNRLNSLFPNDIAIENYTRKVILEKLSGSAKKSRLE